MNNSIQYRFPQSIIRVNKLLSSMNTFIHTSTSGVIPSMYRYWHRRRLNLYGDTFFSSLFLQCNKRHNPCFLRNKVWQFLQQSLWSINTNDISSIIHTNKQCPSLCVTKSRNIPHILIVPGFLKFGVLVFLHSS